MSPLLKGARDKSHLFNDRAGAAHLYGNKSSLLRGVIKNEGMALLAVLALLSIFAILGFAFTMRMRIEETASMNFSDAAPSRDTAQAGLQVVNDSLTYEYRGVDGIPFSGDEPTKFTSNKDRWYAGWTDTISANYNYYDNYDNIQVLEGDEVKDRNHQWNWMYYDVRRWNRDWDKIREYYVNVSIPVPEYDPFSYPLGIDEDPVGDLNSDGYPGIAGVDDDLDGLTDEDSQGKARRYENGKWEADEGYTNDLADDDDEDGQVDEDGLDPLPGGSGTFPMGFGLDNDGDMCGIFDESAKININYVGNLSLGNGGSQGYNQGLAPHEIDLSMFLTGRGLDRNRAVTIAESIVNHRYGDDEKPGTGNYDDRNTATDKPNARGNNDPKIIYNSTNVDVMGNGEDDDGDGVTDDPGEIFISNDVQGIIPGDGLDNDGDGYIDERDEGIDEPGEYIPDRPYGDDNPFNTVEELNEISGMDQVVGNDYNGNPYTIYDLIKDCVTVYSHSPLYTDRFQSENGANREYDRRKINPNYVNNFTPDSSRQDSSYLFPLGWDDDGDWSFPTPTPSSTGVFVSEVNENDYNRNGYPDLDWDSGPERDTYLTADEQNGIDDDRDSLTDAEDTGDYNDDGIIRYDPEFHVNEDSYGRMNNTIGNEPGLPYEDIDNNGDDDRDGRWDFNDPEVKEILDNGIENDNVDNDSDGLTDEVGETYIAAWDDDEDGKYDEDPTDFQFIHNLIDCIDQPQRPQDSVNKSDGLTEYSYEQKYMNKYEPGDVNPTPTPVELASITHRGVEAVVINEVMVSPIIRLQAEEVNAATEPFSEVDDGGFPNYELYNGAQDSHWDVDTTEEFYVVYSAGDSKRDVLNGDYQFDIEERATWTYENIPSGYYYILIYDRDLESSGLTKFDYVDNNTNYYIEVNNEYPDDIVDVYTDNGSCYILKFGDDDKDRKHITDGTLSITLTVPPANLPAISIDELYATFDYVELINTDIQYVELMNLSPNPISITSWYFPIGNDEFHIRDSEIKGFNIEDDPPKNYLVVTSYNKINNLREMYGDIDVDIIEAINNEEEEDKIFEVITFNEDEGTVDLNTEKLMLFDANDNLIDTIDLRHFTEEYVYSEDNNQQKSLGFMAVEKGDPTALEYWIDDPKSPTLFESSRTASRLYAKDALMYESFGNWIWEPRMKEAEPNFFCYTSSKVAGEATWKWPGTSYSEDRIMDVRIYNNSDDPISAGSNDKSTINVCDTWPYGDSVYVPEEIPNGFYIRDVKVPKDEDIEITLSGIADTLCSFSYLEVSTGIYPDYNGNAYLGGSPGRDNFMYQPLRKAMKDGDYSFAALVKNGRIANFGELARIATGKPYWVWKYLKDEPDWYVNYDFNTVKDDLLSQGVIGAAKAADLASMVTFNVKDSISEAGLININTAPGDIYIETYQGRAIYSSSVLMALPWADPENTDLTMDNKIDIARKISAAIIAIRGINLDIEGPFGPFENQGNLLKLLQGKVSSYIPDDNKYAGIKTYVEYIEDNYIKVIFKNSTPAYKNMTPESVWGRVSNLITINSQMFSIFSRGSVVDPAMGQRLSSSRVQAVMER